jgi:hypothetical protein
MAMGLGLSLRDAAAVDLGLFEWGVNIDGALSGSALGPAPPAVNMGGFNVGTGLGTLSIHVAGTGHHTVIVYFDHEIDEAINTFFNEFGAANNLALKPAHQSWEIDEPGFVFGDIYNNFKAGTLDNSNGVPQGTPDDVALALGWDFDLDPGFDADISATVSLQAPPGAFYLQHTDPDSDYTIYVRGGLRIGGGPGPGVPGPGTLILVAGGLGGLTLLRRRTGHGTR